MNIDNEIRFLVRESINNNINNPLTQIFVENGIDINLTFEISEILENTIKDDIEECWDVWYYHYMDTKNKITKNKTNKSEKGK